MFVDDADWKQQIFSLIFVVFSAERNSVTSLNWFSTVNEWQALSQNKNAYEPM